MQVWDIGADSSTGLVAGQAGRAEGHSLRASVPDSGIIRACVGLFSAVCSWRCLGGARQRRGSVAPAAAQLEPRSGAIARALHALFDEEWEHDLAESPVWASSIGDRRYDTRWDDVEPRGAAPGARRTTARCSRRSRASRAAELSKDDALSYDLFRYKYETAVEGQPFRLYLFPINQRGGIQTADEIADELPFATVEELRGLERAARGASPRTWIRRSSCSPRASARAWCIRRSPCSASSRRSTRRSSPTRRRARSSRRTRRSMRSVGRRRPRAPHQRGEALVMSSVVPAFEKLRAFFVEHVSPRVPRRASARGTSRTARALYAYHARSHTTTKPHARPDPRHRAPRGRAHPRRDGGGEGARRLHRDR